MNVIIFIQQCKQVHAFIYTVINMPHFIMSLTDTFLYYFARGVEVDENGGGIIIPLTGDFTK